MTLCKLCGLPEDEHYFDRAAYGCRAFDGQGDHPKRHIPAGRKSNIFVNGLALALYIGCALIVGVIAYCLVMS